MKALAPVLSACTALAVACKPVQSSETSVANTQLGFVSKSCGEDSPYFVANKNMCQDPDVRFTVAAVKLPTAQQAPGETPGVPPQPTGAALLALSTPGLPAPLVHLEMGFQLRDKEGFEKLLRQFGTDPENTAFSGYTRFDGTPRRGMSSQYYRVTDLLGPGFQALAGQLWSGQALVGSWAAVYAVISATPTTLEFPAFDAARFFSLVKPRPSTSGSVSSNSTSTSLSTATNSNSASASISFVKAFQEKHLMPLTRPPVDGTQRLFQRSPQDESAVVERNRGLLPGDVLLVMRRALSASAPALLPSGKSVPSSLSASSTSPSVKSVLANTATDQEKSCLLSGQLVHAALLVEKDAWFESVQTLQGALFRVAPFDDVVLHAQLLAKSTTLGSLCFAVVRRDRPEERAPDGTRLLKAAPPFALASQLSPTSAASLQPSAKAPLRLALGALLAAQGAAPPLAVKYEDALVGRVQVLPVSPGQPPLPFTALSR